MKTIFKKKNHERGSTAAGSRRKQAYLLAFALLATSTLLPARLSAQAEPSAILEVQSTNKGFLLPRMTKGQRDSIASPATGLMIFSTTSGALEMNVGTPAAPAWVRFIVQGEVSSLNCAGAVASGNLVEGQTAQGVSVNLPYAGGNGGGYLGQSIASSGVSGLTATLPSGNFAAGTGSVNVTVSGTPAGGGTATFPISLGEKSCTLSVALVELCGAKVSPSQYKHFMCYNLASANTSAAALAPSWEVNGGYWQWGRKGPGSPGWLNTNTSNFAHGPTGPGPGETNEYPMNWMLDSAPATAWTDLVKTTHDPCPTGFRVPTQAQWQGVLDNNPQSAVGAWSSSPTNYGSGRFFGPDLFLPAAGYRYGFEAGVLKDRGMIGSYWSSTASTSSGFGTSGMLYFTQGNSDMNPNYKISGFSVRCIEDSLYAGSVGAIHCEDAAISGALHVFKEALGISATVPYSGGTGGQHSGQAVGSTGVAGLTATLAAGGFGVGADSLLYLITGTPADTGIASFALDIGGASCTLNLPVGPPLCRARTGFQNTYKNFMCHNLGAANPSANPFQPSWEVNGGYWQWGRKGPASSSWLNTNTEHFAHGPTGPGTGEANEGAIGGWSQADAPDGAWVDSVKTADDPCPPGFRMPSYSQWYLVRDHNTQTVVGSWENGTTNYSSGRFFGPDLMLPAAGDRDYTSGELADRGSYGGYWSSTEISNDSFAGYLLFYSNSSTQGIDRRRSGISVRCIEE